MGVRVEGQVSASFHFTVLAAKAGATETLMSIKTARVLFTMLFIGVPQELDKKKATLMRSPL
jgi:hypothetical protein